MPGITHDFSFYIFLSAFLSSSTLRCPERDVHALCKIYTIMRDIYGVLIPVIDVPRMSVPSPEWCALLALGGRNPDAEHKSFWGPPNSRACN